MTINWKHAIVVLLDVVIAVYLLLAITVLNQPEEKATVCTEVNIHVDDHQNGLLSPAEVKRLLERQRLYPLAQPMQFVSTRNMEEALMNNPYVESVECYKTQNGHVCVNLVQRRPVLHVMPLNDEQYYVDTHGDILPHTRLAGNLLVATGTLERSFAQKRLAPIARQILEDEFWQSQTEQLNVLPDGTLELVPRVGDHIVYLGAPTNIPKKLERLRKFYKYGLSHAGWNRYQRISVEFDNQIVCKRKHS
ncbi:MAG: cell division protein FtsQ [Prevotella sp.]|nr:cell division protein FtsQ [Prevotella sp.]